METKLSTKEFSEKSGVPVSTLNRWVKEGKIVPAFPSAGQGKPSCYTTEQIESVKALRAKNSDAQTLLGFEPSDNEVSHTDNPHALNSEGTLGQPADDTNSTSNVDVKGSQSVVEASECVEPMSDTATPEIDATDVETLTLTPPPSKQPSTSFSFNGLSLDNAAGANTFVYEPDADMSLDARAEKIRQAEKITAGFVIIIGQELIAAKAQVSLGDWTRWLREEFGWKDRRAQNFMQIARRFGNKPTFANFSKTVFDVLLTLPAGEEEEFIAIQASAGRPVESQSARELKVHVKNYKANLRASDPEFEKSSGKPLVEAGTTFDMKDPTRNPSDETLRDASADVSASADAIEVPSSEIDKPDEYKPPIANVGNGKFATNEWYTPTDIIEAARRVLGKIDVDPASCELANQTVKATKFYNVIDNGLNQKWRGNVWINPPYSKIAGMNSADETTAAFANKLLSELEAGSVTAAIWLSHNKTDTSWFAKLAEMSAAIVFSTGRINFLREGVEVNGTSLHGQAFMYFGNDPDAFIAEFSQFGWAVKVIPLKKKKINLFSSFEGNETPTAN